MLKEAQKGCSRSRERVFKGVPKWPWDDLWPAINLHLLPGRTPLFEELELIFKISKFVGPRRPRKSLLASPRNKT